MVAGKGAGMASGSRFQTANPAALLINGPAANQIHSPYRHSYRANLRHINGSAPPSLLDLSLTNSSTGAPRAECWMVRCPQGIPSQHSALGRTAVDFYSCLGEHGDLGGTSRLGITQQPEAVKIIIGDGT